MVIYLSILITTYHEFHYNIIRLVLMNELITKYVLNHLITELSILDIRDIVGVGRWREGENY